MGVAKKGTDMFARFTGLAALLAAGVFVTSPAQAQIAPDPADEDAAMYCAYNTLVDSMDYELVAEAFLYDDLSEADTREAADALAKATADCAAKHKLSDSQAVSISDIGIYGSAADYLSEELMFEDVPDAAIDGIYDVMEGLSDDDLDKLFVDGWRSDLAFSARLKAALIAKGIPDDEYAVETSFQIIELAALALDSVMLFVLGEES
jgi:hypothetical protein